jgi:hypothetical protein
MGTKAGPAALLLAQALGTNFSSDPGKYYTLRLAALEDSARWSNAVARRRALRSLAAYDDTGLVFSLLNDTNPAVRADATNALREIEFYGQSWSSYDYYYTFLNSNPPVRSYPAKYPGIKVPVTRAFMNKDG